MNEPGSAWGQSGLAGNALIAVPWGAGVALLSLPPLFAFAIVVMARET
jgi:hypothetical protein